MDSFPYDLDLLTSIVNAERKSLGSRFDDLLKLCIKKHSEELAKKLAEIDNALRCNAHPAESMARAIWMGDQELIVPSPRPRPEFIFPGVSEINIAGHTLQLPISMPYVDGGFCCRATPGSALAPKLSNAALTTGLAVLLQLPVNTFTVYGIALQNVGDDLALVDALPPNLKGDLVTNARQLDSFMDGLEERTREIRRRCLMHYDSLYQYNSDHATSPEESWFIFVIWEPAIEASQKNRLKNLVTSTACHRAGIHFFVVDHASVQGKYEDWGSLAMLQFDSLDQRHESLEYLTPWPFGVAGRRPLEIGKSRFFAPLLTKDRHLQIAGRLG